MSESIIGAIIGAVATILAAFIPLIYAKVSVTKQPFLKQNWLTKGIIEIYQGLLITNYELLRVEKNSAVVSKYISDVSIGLISVIKDQYGVKRERKANIILTLPEAEHIEIQMVAGWSTRFSYKLSIYKLTLVKIQKDEENAYCLFDIRKVQ